MNDQILTPVKFNPGVVKEQTPKAAEGYWTDADKVRFRFSKPELMGGWQSITTAAQTAKLLGVPRALELVKPPNNIPFAVVGTHAGLYSTDFSTFFNVTPAIASTAGTNILSTVAGSTEITVSLVGHGLTNDSVVGITSAATTIGGNIVLNAIASVTTDYQVSVVNANVFKLRTATTAAATSALTGGAVNVFTYLPAGERSNILTTGWGTGAWSGSFGWGSASGSGAITKLRTWSFDLWGNEMMGVPSGGKLYLWAPQNGVGTRFAVVTAAPSVNQIIRVTDARHAVLYGTHAVDGIYNPLLVRWSSQENYNDWTTSVANTAGDYPLPSQGSEIISAIEVGDRIIILTDFDAFAQTYIGNNDVFGFARIGRNCGALSRYSVIEYGGVLYWMTNNGQFYMYDGRIQPIPCTVLRYVFDNLNVAQKDKICAGSNAQFDELIWFYPSLDSPDEENDRYVIYNTVENHWTVGSLRRNAWRDGSNTAGKPLAAGGEGAGLYFHEVGYGEDGHPMAAHLESAYFDMQGGDDIMFSNKFSPDFCTVPNGTPYTGSVDVYIKTRKYPGESAVIKGPFSITGSTQKVSTRLRGREMAIRFESQSLDQPWRMGEFRMALQPDGKR